MDKVAITGFSDVDRKIISQALSFLTGFPVIRSSSYSHIIFRYGGGQQIDKENWQQLFLCVLSDLTERIRTEQYYEQFISLGNSLEGLSEMEHLTRKMLADGFIPEERKRVLTCLSDVIHDYIRHSYHAIFHLAGEDQPGLECLMEDHLHRSGLHIHIFRGREYPEILNRMMEYLDCSPRCKVETALAEARYLLRIECHVT